MSCGSGWWVVGEVVVVEVVVVEVLVVCCLSHFVFVVCGLWCSG